MKRLPISKLDSGLEKSMHEQEGILNEIRKPQHLKSFGFQRLQSFRFKP